MSDQDCPSSETLQALIAGRLSTEERDRVLVHADGCNECHAAIEVLHETDPAATLPDDDEPRRHRLVPDGSMVGRYRIERPIGIGGMGVVYVAHDPELDRKVAVKLLRRGAADSIERLRREGRALAALSHPNVVAVHDVGDHDDELFIAMEFVDGSNLRGWLTAKRRSWREVVEVALAVGRGLEAAHIAGLVHRDIKPDNILLGTDGRIRIGDFGLVNELPSGSEVGDLELTQTGALLGTPAYMAPEQLDGGEVDARSDQWSFCATVFEALYGVRAFAGKSIDELALAIEDGEIAETRSAGVPRWLRRILVRGLAVDPRKRWPSMRALCDAIERSRRRRKQLAWIVPIGVLACASGGAYIATRPAPVDCTDAGDISWSAWNPIRRALVLANNPEIVPDIDHWMTEWSSARADACTTNIVDDDVRLRRDDCLDHQLDRLSKLADVWQVRPDPETYVEVFDIRDVLPSISRCGQSATAGQPVPTPAQRMKQLAIEADMAGAFALHRHGDAAAITRIGTASLASAKSSGYAPAVVDVARVLAAYLNTAHDYAAEEVAYREGLAAAETAHDDGAKTTMGLRLAAKLALNGHVDESRHFLELGEASAARLPQTPLLDADIAMAEAAVKQGANDFRGETPLLRRVIERRAAVFGPFDREVLQDWNLLAAVIGRYDVTEAARVRAQLDELDRQAGPAGEADMALREVSLRIEAGLRLAFGGDLDGGIRIFEEITAIGERDDGFRPRVPGWHAWAGVLQQLGKHDDLAYRHFARAIELWDRLGVKSIDLATNLGRAAHALVRMKRPIDAVPLARRGIDVATELGSDDDATADRVELGEALVEAGDLAGAREVLEIAVAWRLDHGIAGARGRTKFALARALWPTDRKRAVELARSGRSDLAAQIEKLANGDRNFKLNGWLQYELLAAMDAWLRTHH